MNSDSRIGPLTPYFLEWGRRAPRRALVYDFLERLYRTGESVFETAHRKALELGVPAPSLLPAIATGSLAVPPPTDADVAQLLRWEASNLLCRADRIPDPTQVIDAVRASIAGTSAPHEERTPAIPSELLWAYVARAGASATSNSDLAARADLPSHAVARSRNGKRRYVPDQEAEALLVVALERPDLYNELCAEVSPMEGSSDYDAIMTRERLPEAGMQLQQGIEEALGPIFDRLWMRRRQSRFSDAERAALDDQHSIYHAQHSNSWIAHLPYQERKHEIERLFEEHRGRPPEPLPPSLLLCALEELQRQRELAVVRAQQFAKELGNDLLAVDAAKVRNFKSQARKMKRKIPRHEKPAVYVR